MAQKSRLSITNARKKVNFTSTLPKANTDVTCSLRQASNSSYASRPPPHQRALWWHRSTHLHNPQTHKDPPANTHAQTRRTPQTLPPHRRCSLSLRQRILRDPTSAITKAERHTSTKRKQPEDHLHGPWPSPTTQERSLQSQPAADYTRQIRTLRDEESERICTGCGGEGSKRASRDGVEGCDYW